MDVTHGCSMPWPLLTTYIWICVHGCHAGQFSVCVGCFQSSIRSLVPRDADTWRAWNEERFKKNILLARKEEGRYREEHFKSDIKIFSFKISLGQIPLKKYRHLRLGTLDLPESPGKISTTISGTYYLKYFQNLQHVSVHWLNGHSTVLSSYVSNSIVVSQVTRFFLLCLGMPWHHSSPGLQAVKLNTAPASIV